MTRATATLPEAADLHAIGEQYAAATEKSAAG